MYYPILKHLFQLALARTVNDEKYTLEIHAMGKSQILVCPIICKFHGFYEYTFLMNTNPFPLLTDNPG